MCIQQYDVMHRLQSIWYQFEFDFHKEREAKPKVMNLERPSCFWKTLLESLQKVYNEYTDFCMRAEIIGLEGLGQTCLSMFSRQEVLMTAQWMLGMTRKFENKIKK